MPYSHYAVDVEKEEEDDDDEGGLDAPLLMTGCVTSLTL